MQIKRGMLIEWCGWFCFGNMFLFWLLGSSYISAASNLNMWFVHINYEMPIKLFFSVTYLGYLGLMAWLLFLMLIPVVILFPKRRVIFSLAIGLSVSASMLLVIDAGTYKLYRFHLSSNIYDLAVNGLRESLWALSNLEYFIVSMIVLGLLVIEIIYALCIWRYFLNKRKLKRLLTAGVIFIIINLYASYSLLALATKNKTNLVLLNVGSIFPLFHEIFNSIDSIKNESKLVDLVSAGKPKFKSVLNYPLVPLQCSPPEKPRNVVMIVIDTWRYDHLDKTVAPTLVEFAKKTLRFDNHISGGNATGPGIFSLFYGLPVLYWEAMETQKRGPVFLEQLIHHNYEMNILGSATLNLPAFSLTVFRDIKNLRKMAPGKDPYERDVRITQDFKKFIHERDTEKPFFSFLFYDSLHCICEITENYTPFVPVQKNCNRLSLSNSSDPLPYLNRYKNTLLLIDQQIKEVLETLKTNHLLDNTVIVVTGDHGEEFNDNHLGYWGHSSNFTKYQIQTPLLIYAPDFAPNTYHHQTSHFDIVPTLLAYLLNCKTPPNQFSLGRNLFETTPRPYFIVGSYGGFGIVEPHQIINVTAPGNVNIAEINGRPNPIASLDTTLVDQVVSDLLRFYK